MSIVQCSVYLCTYKYIVATGIVLYGSVDKAVSCVLYSFLSQG